MMRFDRRRFLTATAGLGTAALLQLLRRGADAAPHFAPKAKRVIYLFQSGGPSQIETFDYKPRLRELRGQELPPSVRNGQRLTTMSSGQSSLPLVGSRFDFARSGPSGAWVSSLFPSIAGITDKITVVRSMFTDAINHDPAMTLLQSGAQQPGRPSLGSWLSYGLGSESEDLPAFVVLISKNTSRDAQPLYGRLWSSGFLPSVHQGVRFRSSGDPVLFLSDGTASSTVSRRALIDRVQSLDALHRSQTADPELDTRIAAYELAYRMQVSVPELTDLSREPESTFSLYGADARTPGTYAASCLLARKLVERGVRFVQLYHRDWDHHADLPQKMEHVAAEVDRGTAALITDLEQRGLLEDTLVIWGGEFGRTAYAQGGLDGPNYGRDHHPRCFSMLFAGGGIQRGLVYGETDELSYNIVADAVHVHDLHATILHLLGIDHLKLTYRHLGRDFRLTDVAGKVVTGILG